MYYLGNAGVTTCFNCNKSVRLCAFFDDGEKLIRLQCQDCGASVAQVERETRKLLESRKDKVFLEEE